MVGSASKYFETVESRVYFVLQFSLTLAKKIHLFHHLVHHSFLSEDKWEPRFGNGMKGRSKILDNQPFQSETLNTQILNKVHYVTDITIRKPDKCFLDNCTGIHVHYSLESKTG